jgi:hypothetical protein
MALPPDILSMRIPRVVWTQVSSGVTSSLNIETPTGYSIEGHQLSTTTSVTVISDGQRWYIFDRLTSDVIKASKTIELIDRKNHIEHIFKSFEDSGMDLDHLAHEYNDIEEELMKRPNSPTYDLTIEIKGDIVGW